MSETKDKAHRVTWRGEDPPHCVIAAYYLREGAHPNERYVFKRADGMPVYNVAVDLVATVEVVEDTEVPAC